MLIGTLAFGLLLAGCGKNEAVDKTVNESSSSVHKTQEQAEAQAQAQADYMAEQNAKVKLTNKEHVSYTYHDEDMDETKANYSAVIQNDSKKTVDVSEINIAYLDKKGIVIGSSTSSSVWVSPKILMPGQKAYINAEADISVVSPDEFAKAEMTISPEITDSKNKELPIDGEAMAKHSDTIIGLNGKVKNTTKKPTDYITIGAAFYDKDNKLVTVTYGQVDSALNPGQSIPFTTDSPDLNLENITVPTHYEMFAYMYPSK